MTEQPPEDWMTDEGERDLFSVVVPTFNRVGTIIEALDSVKAQTYRPIEILIADDGSTDGTEQAVAEWIRANARPDFAVKYQWRENQGVCGARNDALAVSSGEFVQFLDSDDLLYPERLEKLVHFFRAEGVDYIETGFEGFVDGDDDYEEVHLGHGESCQISLLLRGRLWPNTLRPAFRRGLIRRIGPWRHGMPTFQDLDFVIRALTLDPLPRVGSIVESLARARRSGDRMSDAFKTLEGRRLRVGCEELLVREVLGRAEFDDEDCVKLRARCLTLALRSKAAGWGEVLGGLLEALSLLPQPTPMKDRLKWLAIRSGRPVCWIVCRALKLAV